MTDGDDLRREVADLRRRVLDLEAEVRALSPATPPTPVPQPAPKPPASPPAPDPKPEPAPVVVNYAAPADQTPRVVERSIEQTLGLKWAAWGGAAAVTLGAALAVKYAYDAGWLGGIPAAAWLAAGLVVALATLAAGRWRCERWASGPRPASSPPAWPCCWLWATPATPFWTSTAPAGRSR